MSGNCRTGARRDSRASCLLDSGRWPFKLLDADSSPSRWDAAGRESFSFTTELITGFRVRYLFAGEERDFLYLLQSELPVLPPW